MSKEIYLPSPGALPGIPGLYAAGHYLIDDAARTLRPLPPSGDAPPAQPVSLETLSQEVAALADEVAREEQTRGAAPSAPESATLPSDNEPPSTPRGVLAG